MTDRVWFITGASSGFGRAWTTAALARGERVAATSRRAGALDDLVADHGDALLPLTLQVTDRAAVLDAVAQAHDRFGRLDVVVNNAGYGTNGMMEEIQEDATRAQLETNVLAPLWVVQGALPFLREQGSGHIINVSSVAAHASFPGLGMYCSSKWALEGWTGALAKEVVQFGVKVTMIEPGGFDTGAASSAVNSPPLEAYGPMREAAAALAAQRRSKLGDPEASTAVLLEIIESEDPPLRCFFGPANLGMIEPDYLARLENWRRLQHLAERAAGD